MAEQILMPKLGLTMKTGTVVKWFKNEGDLVAYKEHVLEIETEKLTHQIESPAAGALIKKTAAVGEKYPVSHVLGFIGSPGERVDDDASATSAYDVSSESEGKPEGTAAANTTVSGIRTFISPLAKKLAATLGIDYGKIRGTGPSGRIVKSDVDEFAEKSQASGGNDETAMPHAEIHLAIDDNMPDERTVIPISPVSPISPISIDAGEFAEKPQADGGSEDTAMPHAEIRLAIDDNIPDEQRTAIPISPISIDAGESAEKPQADGGSDESTAIPHTEIHLVVDDSMPDEQRTAVPISPISPISIDAGEFAEKPQADGGSEDTAIPHTEIHLAADDNMPDERATDPMAIHHAMNVLKFEKHPPTAGSNEDTIVPYAGMRRAIGDNMLNAWATIPMVTHHVMADATELMEYRARLNRDVTDKNDKVSVNDLMLKLTATALADTPVINSSLTDKGVVFYNRVHMGMAASIDDGLVVPVIRDANLKSLLQISKEAKDLAERARNGTLGFDETAGGTFTITNLGAYGSVDLFNPIINPPQAAILGVGRVVETPTVVNSEITIRSMMGLSLTYDHRIIDGAIAAGFVKKILQLMENPARSVLY